MGTVSARIIELKKQIEAVRLNPDLSDAGREKRVKELQTQLRDYQPVAIRALQKQADEIRAEFRSLNDERYPAAIERAARQWDFQRLVYERSRMETDLSAIQLQPGDLLTAIEAAYSKVMSSGDRYSQRVWSELAPSPILAQFGVRSGGLITRMEANAETLRDTPDLQVIRAESGLLAKRAGELQRDVKDVMPQLSYDGQIALQKSMTGIHVTERIVPQTLTLETSLSVDEASPTAEGAPVAAAAVAA